jgi:hypothetical protein
MATFLEHIVFMTPRSVSWLAGNLGLEVRRVRHCGLPYPMGICPPGVDGQSPCPTPNQGPPPASTGRNPRGPSRGAAAIRRLAGTAAAYFGQQDGGGHLGRLARGLLDRLMIGDHLEVCLLKPE